MDLNDDRGSAVAEFAMVGAVLVLTFLAALQVGFALHVRNTLIADASDGARYGARADSSPGEGAGRAGELITKSLGGRYAGGVSAATESIGGARVVTVTVHAPLPIVGPWGLGASVTVKGHAYAEGQ